MVSGLFALVLLASLAGSALAAEAAKKEVPKPTGQFTQWFPWMGADPDAPEASEAVLAQMGTVINQTKTVGGETLTLNGALWEGDSVHLSFHESAAPDPIYGPADSDLQPKGLPDFGQSKGTSWEKDRSLAGQAPG